MRTESHLTLRWHRHLVRHHDLRNVTVCGERYRVVERVLEHQGVGDALSYGCAQVDCADDPRASRLELDLVVLVLARRLVREHDLKTVTSSYVTH